MTRSPSTHRLLSFPALFVATGLFLASGCGTGSVEGTAFSPPSPPEGAATQSPADRSPGAPPPAEEEALTGDAARQGLVEMESDPDLDFRSWRLIPMQVTETSFTPGVDPTGSELRMGAIALSAGPNHPIGPNQSGLQLFFMGISHEWVYEGEVDVLHLRIGGGEPVQLGLSTYRESPGQGYVLETMGVRIPAELLLRLSRATSVEGQLGPTEFRLGPDQLQRFRAFVDELPADLLGAVTG